MFHYLRRTTLGAGKVSVRAIQTGGHTYKPAAPVARTITVNKAPLSVSFDSASRLVRQPDPAFRPIYTGFVNGDTETDLATTRPVGKTTAKIASPAGQYPITLKGGLDANYRYVPGAPAYLTVEGFGGAYEALLFDESGVPTGKLELLVPDNALTYTGSLHLALEAKAIAIRGTLSVTEGVASFTWTRSATATASGLYLEFVLAEDVLDGNVTRNQMQVFSAGDSGSRLFVQSIVDGQKQKSPWAGQHTLVFRDPVAINETDARALPLGAGHAATAIADTGAMTLKGRLADGTLLTASSKADVSGRFRLFARPYGKRLNSFFSGSLPLAEHPDQARFPCRYAVSEENGRLFWAKAALPETTPSKNQDKSYHLGFESRLSAMLDPWLAPSTKVTTFDGVDIPAGTLAQRLGLVAGPSDTATVAVNFTSPEGVDFGARASSIPATLNLAAAGAFTVPPPLPAAALNPGFTLTVTPATGAFSGSFVLSDTPAGATKPVKRKVTVSGTLRQGYSGLGSPVGDGHFLLTPLPTSEPIEAVSGEFRLFVPGE